MPIFQLRLLKSVPDDQGHDHLACQWQVQLEARNDRDACLQAVAAFCRSRGVADWTHYADALEARQLSTGHISSSRRATGLSTRARPQLRRHFIRHRRQH